jgi:hypothetical protein
MSEGTDRDTRPAGRDLSMLVFGDNADEIELAALDEARAFFGDHAHLTVVQGYKSYRVHPDSALSAEAAGKKYNARVTVRTIETA